MLPLNDTLEPKNTSYPSEILNYRGHELNIAYMVCEIIVAILAVLGNTLVIFVFCKERRLRRRTNYYIVSLAVADLLVGLLGIPFAIMSSVGLPTNLHACLFTVSLLLVLCTISIFCLLAVSIDRYWAILHPMGYSRNVRTKTALIIISICWLTGSIIGFLPLIGWHSSLTFEKCFFLDVMDYNYLVFLYFGTIITPSLLMAAFYAHIYRVVVKQLRQIVTMNPEKGSSSGGTMLRMLGAAQKREVKATQNLAIIVVFFMICWIPLYTINCTLAFCHTCKVDPTFMNCCIILSHLNSAGNPLLYAYNLKDFRAALKNFFCSTFGNGLGSLQIAKNRASMQSHMLNSLYNSRARTLRSTRSDLHLNQHSCKESPTFGFMANKSRSVQLPLPPPLSPTTVKGETARTIFRIPELPSTSDDKENSFQHVHISVVQANKGGKLNSGYSDDGDLFHVGNEEVFVDDTIPISEFKCAHDVRNNRLSSSSSQLSPNLFLVEKEALGGFSPRTRKYIRSNSAVEYNEAKRNFLSPSSRNLSLSQFKCVNDVFLLNNHARSSSDLSNISSDSGYRNNCAVFRRTDR